MTAKNIKGEEKARLLILLLMISPTYLPRQLGPTTNNKKKSRRIPKEEDEEKKYVRKRALSTCMYVHTLVCELNRFVFPIIRHSHSITQTT